MQRSRPIPGRPPTPEMQPLPVVLPLEIIAHIVSFLAPRPPPPPEAHADSSGAAPPQWSYADERELRHSRRDLARATRVCRSLLPVVRRLLYARMTLASPRAARFLAERLRLERDSQRADLPSGLSHSTASISVDARLSSSLPVPGGHADSACCIAQCAASPAPAPRPTGFSPEYDACAECALIAARHDFDERISPLLQSTIYDGRCRVAVQRSRARLGPDPGTQIHTHSDGPAAPPVAPLRISTLVKQLYFPHSNGVPGLNDDDDDMGQWRCSVRTIFDVCAQLRCVSLVIPPEGGMALEELMEVTTRARLDRLEILCTRYVASPLPAFLPHARHAGGVLTQVFFYAAPPQSHCLSVLVQLATSAPALHTHAPAPAQPPPGAAVVAPRDRI